jgi:6-phosphogluconolactonase
METYVYVGTYTRLSKAEGIYVFRLDPSTGALSHVQTVAEQADPSYLALGRDGRHLYAVNELDPDGQVSAFTLEPSSGHIEPINSVSSRGAHPAHLSVHPSGRWLGVANYSGGTIASFPIQPDGSLGDAADVVDHSGSGPNPKRQEGPHPHMIVSDPNGAFLLVPDLGTDRVVAYRLDTTTGKLSEQPRAGGQLAPGAGPRHLTFGPDGRHAYVINELASTITVFDYQDGTMKPVQSVTTLPDDYSGSTTTAAIVSHPTGQWVYGSNRGHDSVATFAVDADGRLTPRGQVPTQGRTPRDINIDPSGSFLLAANQGSDSITTFRIRPGDGALEPTGLVCEVPAPVRVLFVMAG